MLCMRIGCFIQAGTCHSSMMECDFGLDNPKNASMWSQPDTLSFYSLWWKLLNLIVSILFWHWLNKYDWFNFYICLLSEDVSWPMWSSVNQPWFRAGPLVQFIYSYGGWCISKNRNVFSKKETVNIQVIVIMA